MKKLTVGITYILLAFSFFFSYFFRVSTSVVLPGLQDAWGLSAGIIGFISSMYFYTYATMQPLCGVLNDYYGPMKVAGTGLVITSAGSVIFGFGNTPGALIAGRLLMGIGLSPMLSGLVVFQGMHFKASHYALFSGLSLMTGNMGAVFSVAPLQAALNRWDMPVVFTVLAAITLLFAGALIPLGITHSPSRRAGTEGSIVNEVARRFMTAIRTVGRTRELKLIIAAWTVVLGSLMAYQGLWAVSWFRITYPAFERWAGVAATTVGIGVMTGNFTGGHLCKDSRKRHRVIAVLSLLIFSLWILLILSFVFVWPLVITVIFSALLGFFNGNIAVQLTAGTNDLTPKDQGGAVFGIVNGSVFFSVILYQWGTGALIGFFQKTLESAQAFAAAFVAVLITTLVPCVASLTMRAFTETAPNPPQSPR
jgi:MFS family permease